jgi:capsular exopolysaccharide synthesis family protein
VDLVEYLSVLRRRWLVIVLCIIAGVAGGYDVGHRGTKQYAAVAQCIVVLPPGTTLQDQLAGSQLSSNLVSTYARLVSSRVVRDYIEATLGTSVQGAVAAAAEPNTYLIDIQAKADDPAAAQALANTAAKGLSRAVTRLQSDLSQPISIKIDTKAALPVTPISPKPKTDLTLGIILGILGGLLAAALLEALDRTIKTPAQATQLFDAPLLALVPKRRGDMLALSRDGPGPEGEPYRSLRTAVRFVDPDRPLRTLLVTSPTPTEGKTTTAANLAVALALSGERVIVVDADLRRATLALAFGLERAVGLTSLVLRKATIDDALQTWDTNLQVLASGPLPPNPSEILGSQLVNRLITDLAGRADIVIIDAPPVLPVADAVALAAQVDGVLMVTRHGSTLRNSAAEAARRLESVGARIVGYVLNAVPANEARGYYAYYRYERERSRPRRRDGRTVDRRRSMRQRVPARPDVYEPTGGPGSRR